MRKSIGGAIPWLMAAAALAGGEKDAAPAVVFVCEHGAAKSVVAAAHFNRLARERGLALRAVARGTVPDERMAPVAVTGLAADGLAAPAGTPVRVRAEELSAARRTVAMGCDVARVAPRGARVERWDDIPPMSAGYGASRDAIVERVKKLLDELAPAAPR
jgi:arsenate reductase (thioredoxin)